MTHLLWLSDDAWAAIEPHLPRGKPGKPRVDDRRVISGILHVLKTGCRWRDCPAKYGPHTTIYNRYNRWSKRRIWQRIFEKMAAAGPVPEELCIDTSHVKAHTLGPMSAQPTRQSDNLGPNKIGTQSSRSHFGWKLGSLFLNVVWKKDRKWTVARMEKPRPRSTGLLRFQGGTSDGREATVTNL